MLIRSAIDDDREAICLLWKDCFSDPDDYIDFYMTKRFRADFCAILEENREVVGMIHLLPCIINPNQKAFYWYAAGIRRDYRNKGLFRKFASLVKKKVNELGYQNVCVPALGLEEYYKLIGFHTQYTATDYIYVKNDLENFDFSLHFENATAFDFCKLNKDIHGNIIWDQAAIKYAIEENIYCNGLALKFQFKNKNYVFFAIQKEDGILIDNHNMSEKVFLIAKSAIFHEFNCNRLIFRTTGSKKIVGLSDSNFIEKEAKITMTLA